MEKLRIAVLFGGISPERNVSINGGRAVVDALRNLGHNVVPVDPAFGIDAARSEASLVSAEAQPTLEELTEFPSRNIINCINSDIFDKIDLEIIKNNWK